jgi:hypothetical protein
MKYILLILVILIIGELNGLVIVDKLGVSHEYSYESFVQLPAGQFSTSREKDGVINTYSWSGIRFDQWLVRAKLGDFAKIRFISADKYEVSFSKAQWDTLSCWLTWAEGGKVFPNDQMRIIFPHLREMHWVRDIQQIVLEDFKKISLPGRLISMTRFLQEQPLAVNPEPFVKASGYRFDQFLSLLSDQELKDVILYSKDGLIQNLQHPLHLEGAILEPGEKGGFNLKSPQVPGGMWLRDIIYLQCDSVALIDLSYVSRLIELARLLEWQLDPDVKIVLVTQGVEEEYSFGDALAEPKIFEGAEYFQILK